MSTLTPKLNFIKPELSDAANIEATNPNWDKLDEKMVSTDLIGKPNGVCPLGEDGKIPLEYGGGVPITLTATTDPGATVTATDGVTTLTQEAPEGTAVFSLPNAGEWTASAEKDGKSSLPIVSNVLSDYQTNVPILSKVLNENSWLAIHQAALTGQGDNYWDVGDTKSIVINGPVGKTNFDNLAIDVFIIGFNHNATLEGNHKIHFQIGKIGGKAVALCDSKYGSDQRENGWFNWNPNNFNTDGWASSYRRQTLYGNTNTPTNPLAGSLMAALPADLREVMQTVTKYTDNFGNSSHVRNHVTATMDYLGDLAEFEVFGTEKFANQYEQNSQQQYQYYKAGNPKIAYNHTSTASAVWWGLRSASRNGNDQFCRVGTNGIFHSTYAYVSGGLRPGFAV